MKKAVKKVQKWLDGFKEVRKGQRDCFSEVLSGFDVDIKEGNYYTIFGV